MMYVRNRGSKMDGASREKTPDTTAGTTRRRNAQTPGDRGSYFWKNRCVSCGEVERAVVRTRGQI